MKDVTHPELKDSKGRLMPTVVGLYISDEVQEDLERVARSEQDALLIAIYENPKASLADLARRLQWWMPGRPGDPYKMKVKRSLVELEKTKPKVLTMDRDKPELTKAGTQTAKKLIEQAMGMAGAYGGDD
jgi:hypothetical protein